MSYFYGLHNSVLSTYFCLFIWVIFLSLFLFLVTFFCHIPNCFTSFLASTCCTSRSGAHPTRITTRCRAGAKCHLHELLCVSALAHHGRKHVPTWWVWKASMAAFPRFSSHNSVACNYLSMGKHRFIQLTTSRVLEQEPLGCSRKHFLTFTHVSRCSSTNPESEKWNHPTGYAQRKMKKTSTHYGSQIIAKKSVVDETTDNTLKGE